jgi:hypothetical protein
METTWFWAHITQLSPLMVQRDGNGETPFQVGLYGSNVGLAVNERVLCHKRGKGTRVIAPHAALTATPVDATPPAVTWTSPAVIGSGSIQCRRWGPMCMLEFYGFTLGTAEAAGWKGSLSLATVPAGFRPNGLTQFAPGLNGEVFTLDVNGVLWLRAAMIALTATTVCYAQFTYLCV